MWVWKLQIPTSDLIIYTAISYFSGSLVQTGQLCVGPVQKKKFYCSTRWTLHCSCWFFCWILPTRWPSTSQPPMETPGTAAHCTTSTRTSPMSTWRLWSPSGRSARTTTGSSLLHLPGKRSAVVSWSCRVLPVCHFSGLSRAETSHSIWTAAEGL